MVVGFILVAECPLWLWDFKLSNELRYALAAIDGLSKTSVTRG